jgi:hypothetical protein
MAHLKHTAFDVSSVSDIYRTDKNRIKKAPRFRGAFFMRTSSKSSFRQEDISDYNQSE